jgi:RNA polymerase sigma-70 factor (ECF subfamily)
MPNVAIDAGGQRVDERELISRVLAGDRVAGRRLYDAHAPRIYRLTYRLVGDATLAEEFTQDTFVRAFSRLDRFRGDASFSTWLHRIALSVTSNGMRRVRRLRSREMDLDDDAHPRTEGISGDPVLRTRLAEALDRLPEALRFTLVMHDLEGYTHAEIARALGVAEGTSKSRLFDARARLREALREYVTES